MDLRNIPYRSDVLAWNPDDLAEYFRTLKYKDCEKVVRKYSINGQRFLNMSENDVQKFPKLRVPAQTQRSPENLGYSQDDGGWSSFDDEDDDDYESPDEDQDKEEADYESPTEDPEEAEHDSDGYEPPPSNNDEAHHNVIFPAKSLPSNTDYIGKKPSIPEKPLASQLRSLGEQLAMMPKPPVPPSDRYERGNPPALRKQNPAKKKKRAEQSQLPQPFPFVTGPFQLATLMTKSIFINNATKKKRLCNNSRSPSRGSADPRPPMPIPSRQTGHQTSPEEDEDGTFLVRDSSRKTVTHPYVLMVLYRDKVYNIQIRYQEQDHLYLLGTGLRGKEDFSSVADIIDHFQRTPLLLIDGKDRGSRNQCMLKYAAGHI
ncbi:Lymphocyte cytosolic protein 2 [Willisornis vidua]|uniref:Lymphocyte cytosolic protein 2 n=1 Tax=Willisornis vidua TaxID=1566151 RepID=A0ABQ9DWZ9_9PASS|nr:Lymphocyte cytosolic protein 2 [Willisornis vidua]